jgi:hypothetical protein
VRTIVFQRRPHTKACELSPLHCHGETEPAILRRGR